jgi:hypothetical protein
MIKGVENFSSPRVALLWRHGGNPSRRRIQSATTALPRIAAAGGLAGEAV